MGSDQERLIAELRQSEEKFARVFQTSPYAITITRAADGSFVDVNDAFTAITGFTRVEALAGSSIGLKLWVNEADRQRVVTDLGAGRAVVRQEFQFRTKSGQIVTCLFSAQVIRLNAKPCILSSIEDITGRKQMETELQESEALMRTAGRVARFGGWSVDLATNKVVWSEQVCAIHDRLAGYSPPVEEGISYYAPECRARITEIFSACARDGVPYDEELEIISAAGRRVWVRTIGEAVRDEQGKIWKVQGAFQDISERKRAEVDLKARARELQDVVDVQIGRENIMIALEHEVNALLKELGREPKYK